MELLDKIREEPAIVGIKRVEHHERQVHFSRSLIFPLLSPRDVLIEDMLNHEGIWWFRVLK